MATAGLIDRGLEDYMLETAMLKVYSTEALWTIVNDAFQIHGGAAYFNDCPLERILRDARINQIGEGANEVLLSFIALVGMRDRGEHLRGVWEALHDAWRQRSRLGRFAGDELRRLFHFPRLPVPARLSGRHGRTLSRLIHRFGQAVGQALIWHREEILDRQLVQQPIAWAAMELFASVCTLSRRAAEMESVAGAERAVATAGDSFTGPAACPPATSASWEAAAADLFLRQSARRIGEALFRLRHHDHPAVFRAARRLLDSLR